MYMNIAEMSVEEVDVYLRGLPSERRVIALDGIASEEFRSAVASKLFGPALAKSLGYASNADNPKTDYGEPSYCGSWDIADK